MKIEAEDLKNNQIKLTITLPKDKVENTFNSVLKESIKNAEVKGFRKGKAPKEEVLKNLDKNSFNSHILEHLVSDAYRQAIKERHLKPISNPKVTMKKFNPEKFHQGEFEDVQFMAEVAQLPKVDLGDYKKALKEKSKESKIIYGPDGHVISKKDKRDTSRLSSEKAISRDGKKLKQDNTKSIGSKMTAPNAIEAVVKEAKVNVPDLLVDQEVERMLSRLLDQTQRLGITVDQYLSSQNKKPEDLREEYKKQATNNLKAEFVLSELATKENITVTDKEIEDSIKAAPDQKSKNELQRDENKWYIKSVLTKNKTVSRLLEIAEKR